MNSEERIEVSVTDILPNPNQPRKLFDPDQLSELGRTIKQNGLMEPLWVIDLQAPDIPTNISPTNGEKYLLIDGERRLRAQKDIGLEKTNVMVLKTTYKDAFHKGIIKQATTAEHSDFEKARGIVADLDNHLSQVEGFSNLKNGSVTFINLLHRESRGKGWDIGLSDETLDRMKQITEDVCASAGYTVDSVRTAKLPLLNIKEDLEEEFGKEVEIRPKKRGEKRTWKIPASTLSRLNSIEDREMRKAAVAYVKRHQLTRPHAQKLAKVINNAEPDIIDSLLRDNISLDEAETLAMEEANRPREDASVEDPRSEEVPNDPTGQSSIPEEPLPEIEPEPELQETEDEAEVQWESELYDEPEPVDIPEITSCKVVKDTVRTMSVDRIRAMPAEQKEETVKGLREIRAHIDRILKDIE